MNSENFNSLITVIILTKNESVHIARAINSAKLLTNKVYVIDSDSTDDTVQIALYLGAKVLNASFDIFSDKLNWCINNLDIDTPWVLRLDADEYFDQRLIINLKNKIVNFDDKITAIYLRRQLWFMNQHIRFGGLYPNYSLRLWRNKVVLCESRNLDEHLIVKYGISIKLKYDIIDNPINTISHWILKHNNYAKLEASSKIKTNINEQKVEIKNNLFGKSHERKRWLKNKFYNRLPLFIRPIFYYLYRYIFLFGFLDGIPGLLYHFYHAFWYRILIDTIIFEQKIRLKNR